MEIKFSNISILAEASMYHEETCSVRFNFLFRNSTPAVYNF